MLGMQLKIVSWMSFKKKSISKHRFSKHEMSSSASKKLSPFRLQASLLLAIIASTQIAARF